MSLLAFHYRRIVLHAACAAWLHLACAFLVAQQSTYRRFESETLENGYVVNDKLLSGGEPIGRQAFAELQRLGVTTVISVDGGKPDLETAAKFGMKYLHIPIGYDNIPREKAAQLAKAARELEGKAYLHCHHGKHRGPAAISIMCRSAFAWSPEQGDAWMKQAGTSPAYRGLWQSALRETPPTEQEIAAIVDPLPSEVEPPKLVAIMIDIDRRFEQVTSPASDVLPLVEYLREWDRTGPIPKEDEAKFRAALRHTQAAIEKLSSLKGEEWTKAHQAVGESCKACHKNFRDGE